MDRIVKQIGGRLTLGFFAMSVLGCAPNKGLVTTHKGPWKVYVSMIQGCNYDQLLTIDYCASSPVRVNDQEVIYIIKQREIAYRLSEVLMESGLTSEIRIAKL